MQTKKKERTDMNKKQIDILNDYFPTVLCG